MKPPLLIRLLPDRFKTSVASRVYRTLPPRLQPLMNEARLTYAHGAKMPCLHPTDVISQTIALTGFYELELTRQLARLAQQGGRLIDVGANQGYFTLVWLANHSDNLAVAIEASPRNIGFLQGNLGANHFESRCQVIDSAAGATRGRMSFDLGPEEQTGWGGLTSETQSATAVEVNVIPLDDLVTDEEPFACLKIDVEGADTWVLEGARRMLERKQINNIFFEQNAERMQRLGINSTECQRFMKDVGYRVDLMSGSPDGLAEYWARPS